MKLTFHLVFERHGDTVRGRCLEIPGITAVGTNIADCKEELWMTIKASFVEQAESSRGDIPKDAIEVEITLS